jgi:hypothetical protein
MAVGKEILSTVADVCAKIVKIYTVGFGRSSKITFAFTL